MKILLKSTMLTPLFLCLMGWYTPKALFVNSTAPVTDVGGHIEQLTSMLIAESSFPDGKIRSLKMEGVNTNYSFQGCGEKRCAFGISHVVPGRYLVTVVTNKDEFQEEIDIK